MSVADWITSSIAAIGVAFGGWVGVRQVRTATAADEDRAASAIQERIAEARAEERARLSAQIEDLRSDRDQAYRDRDYERTRADNLQTLINQWRMDGRGGS